MENNILVVGVIGLDSVRNARGSVQKVVGGSGAYAALSASYFGKTYLMSVVGQDFTAAHMAPFKKRKVDMQGVQNAPGKTFFWEASYDKDFKNAFTEVTDLNVLHGFKPKVLPAHKDAQAVFLANIDPLMQLDVIKQLGPQKRIITCDTMNYWIESNLSAVKKVIKKQTYFL
ncbi:sugar/nucleoside kinase (ribokinase family) [Elusimicrobium posterum]|uniref:hypothetical protein n=1 Tax=Elusimicrobium posterum TaxID=3116653 RepID=UPI003C710504